VEDLTAVQPQQQQQSVCGPTACCACCHGHAKAQCSDVTKLVKLRIRQMRILTFKIRQMQMRMQIEAFILLVGM